MVALPRPTRACRCRARRHGCGRLCPVGRRGEPGRGRGSRPDLPGRAVRLPGDRDATATSAAAPPPPPATAPRRRRWRNRRPTSRSPSRNVRSVAPLPAPAVASSTTAPVARPSPRQPPRPRRPTRRTLTGRGRRGRPPLGRRARPARGHGAERACGRHARVPVCRNRLPGLSPPNAACARSTPASAWLRVDVAIRAAAATLVATSARIAVVRAAIGGDVELTLDRRRRAPDAVARRRPARGASPDDLPVELLADVARTVGAPCVALTQLGVDADGGEVLADLEALGVLGIDAPAPLADAVVRGIAATLATSVFAESANLVGVGIDESSFLDHRRAHVVDTVDDALELAATLIGTTATAPQSTFVLRARHTSGEAWEPAVVLVGSDAAGELDADAVHAACRSRRGRRRGRRRRRAGCAVDDCASTGRAVGRSSRQVSSSVRSACRPAMSLNCRRRPRRRPTRAPGRRRAGSPAPATWMCRGR